MDLGASQVPLGGQIFGTQCASLVQPIVAGAEILRLHAAEVHNFSFAAIPFFNPVETTSLDFCNVSLTLTHPGANDTVFVSVWLPLTDWNGRYQATGGGGLAAGMGPPMLANALGLGYATSSTDGGLTLNNTVDPQSGKWALKEDGTSNDDLQLNLAWRSIHDMVVVSKDLIEQFYGVKPSYSYWHGCSQGGRQGYAAAAKYPHDFDGILAIAPALDLAELVTADFWPAVAMQNEVVPPFCIFEEYHKAINAKCDPLDGVIDGLISDHDLMESCPFDPHALVGQVVACEGVEDVTITREHANVVKQILQGPRTTEGKSLWYGLAPGAAFFALAKTAAGPDGTFAPVPFAPSVSWIKHFVFQDPAYDTSQMTYSDYDTAFEISVSKLSVLWGNQHLDLTDFKHSGGKLLTWFGLADEYIAPSNMLRYREGLEKRFGGAEVVDEFHRLFFAPGAGHCAGGHGPLPVDALNALRDWVENGTAPDVLPALTTTSEDVKVSRNLCRYPKKLVYREGEVNLASSFVCE
ncbi:uncharacterized protein A1O9_11859 [Exophiala aquamarina CBS 119918]|uniref:Carboxylic ester hydrolase n=1 Tax=Exophiala aquamarina CBS 119918 TaxID=1182545 RepID=A0A072NXT9_9EURO|nr:uncharacterized protein A1O9_11859 [Exophiala aquamarina CBS 119918]KEF52232.1 hypothetical protein A1O9_11859 [Exophiala aquamarina CBS 119918]